jgi:tRNA (cytosine38-C5)-methyltransferase
MRDTQLRAVEFYCGIGGLHWALKRVRPQGATVVASYDVNPLAADTYALNFGTRPSGTDIRALKAAQLDALEADLWLLSPPCQPYTRQGLQLDTEDGRAGSLTVLIGVLCQMRRPPRRLLLENVCGFDKSEMRNALVAALTSCGYTLHEFVLTPTQCGVPLSRPRYFLLAALRPGPACRLSVPLACTPCTQLPPPAGADAEECNAAAAQLRFYLEESDAVWGGEYAVPWSAVRTSLLAIDFVNPATCLPSSANCVTKAYGRYAKGTGSLVIGSEEAVHRLFATVQRDAARNAAAAGVEVPANPGGGKAGMLGPLIASHVHDWPADAPPLRYLTPSEIARLHGFPDQLVFPDHVTRLQRYALLGNSLSVDVVARLLEHLLEDW